MVTAMATVSLLMAVFYSGVVGTNWILFDKSTAIRRGKYIFYLIAAAFLVTVAANLIFIAWPSHYIWVVNLVLAFLLPAVGMGWLFLWPIFRERKKIASLPVAKLILLVVFSLVCAIGSIYIPIRGTNNDIRLRTLDVTVQKELKEDIAAVGREAAFLSYQSKHLYDVEEYPISLCTSFLRSQAEKIFEPEKEPMHVTVLFWVDRFVVYTPFLEDVFECRMLNLKPKRSNLTMFWSSKAYEWMVGFIWFDFFLVLLLLLFGRPYAFVRNIWRRE